LAGGGERDHLAVTIDRRRDEVVVVEIVWEVSRETLDTEDR